jgi:hypothetical protein
VNKKDDDDDDDDNRKQRRINGRAREVGEEIFRDLYEEPHFLVTNIKLTNSMEVSTTQEATICEAT